MAAIPAKPIIQRHECGTAECKAVQQTQHPSGLYLLSVLLQLVSARLNRHFSRPVRQFAHVYNWRRLQRPQIVLVLAWSGPAFGPLRALILKL